MQNIIAIENGVVRHPLYRMKKPINMTLAEGEHIAIVGANGSGKTTLFNGITAELPCLNGHILLDGENIHKMNFKQRARKLAIVAPAIRALMPGPTEK